MVELFNSGLFSKGMELRGQWTHTSCSLEVGATICLKKPSGLHSKSRMERIQKRDILPLSNRNIFIKAVILWHCWAAGICSNH